MKSILCRDCFISAAKISIKSGEAAKGDAKGFINPLAGGVIGVTPYSVGRCHEVTEGTGDRWEQSPPDKAVNQAQR